MALPTPAEELEMLTPEDDWTRGRIAHEFFQEYRIERCSIAPPRAADPDRVVRLTIWSSEAGGSPSLIGLVATSKQLRSLAEYIRRHL